MKYLYQFAVLENVQLADKLLKQNGIEKSKVVSDFMSSLAIKGYSNYISYIISILILESESFEESIEDRIQIINMNLLLDSLEKCRQFKIDINNIDVPTELHLFYHNVAAVADKNEIKKFIKKWIPSNIRNEFDYDNINTKLFNISRIQNLSDNDIELIKKGSRCKTVKEWVDYIILVLNNDEYSLTDLLKSNIKIYYQDNEWIFYTPLDFKSYLIPKFKYWCTSQEVQFKNYQKSGFKILLNKEDKSKSLFIYKSQYDIHYFDYKNTHIDLSDVEESAQQIINKYFQN